MFFRSLIPLAGHVRFVPSSVHGIVDYVIAVALMGAPNLVQFPGDGGAAEWLPRLLGVAVFVLALLTDYEVGPVKIVPMRTHLALDALVGLTLVAGAFVFGFLGGPWQLWLPHLAVGIAELGFVLLSDATAYRDRRAAG